MPMPPGTSSFTIAFTAPFSMDATVPVSWFLALMFNLPLAIITEVALMMAVTSLPGARPRLWMDSMDIVEEMVMPFPASTFTIPFTAPSLISFTVPLIWFLALII